MYLDLRHNIKFRLVVVLLNMYNASILVTMLFGRQQLSCHTFTTYLYFPLLSRLSTLCSCCECLNIHGNSLE